MVKNKPDSLEGSFYQKLSREGDIEIIDNKIVSNINGGQQKDSKVTISMESIVDNDDLLEGVHEELNLWDD